MRMIHSSNQATKKKERERKRKTQLSEMQSAICKPLPLIIPLLLSGYLHISATHNRWLDLEYTTNDDIKRHCFSRRDIQEDERQRCFLSPIISILSQAWLFAIVAAWRWRLEEDRFPLSFAPMTHKGCIEDNMCREIS